MARKPRLHLAGGLYHVIWRGNEQRDVFFDDEDRERFYALLGEGVERFGYRVHGFCLMSNHIHLALQAGNEPLSRPLQNLAFRYTQAINRKHARVGHLFQGRYKALLVDHDAYLLELVRYIHLNPVRARVTRDPSRYAWSGHCAYLGSVALPWLTTEAVLGQLGGSVGVARRRYARFVSEGIGEGYRAEFHAGQEDSRVIGDEHFVERLNKRSAIPIVPKARTNLDKIITHVCRGYGLEEAALRAPGRQRMPAQARALVGWLVIQSGAGTLAQVAQRFGREASGLSKQVQRLAREARADTSTARALEQELNSVSQA